MSSHSYEIEIKTLLGEEKNALRLKERMKEKDPSFSLRATSSQLNHYFAGSGTLADLLKNVEELLDEKQKTTLRDIVLRAQQYSVRTRLAVNSAHGKANEEVLLVVKASVDDTTSENGTARIEFEATLPLTLDELDRRVLASGFAYQAKWSRDREEYLFLGTNVCIDRNAGYGYLAEFEVIGNDADKLDEIKQNLRSLMAELGAKELPQDRLERMFAHYNANWQKYYGTDKVFTVE